MQHRTRNMGTCFWLNFMWFLCASEGVSALKSSLPHESFIEERVLAAQVNLAKSFHCRDRESSMLMNVSTTEPLILQVGFKGVSSFWAFSEIHILADSSIHRLYESEGSLKMTQLAELPDIAFSDQLAFVESVEWRRILFILIAFKTGSCRLYTATNSMKITSRQTIYNFGPQDAEFFTYEKELFLIVISSKPDSHMVPSYIYRWTGTHFDEIHTFITSGAVAVSTYHFKGAVIITVARYPYDNPKIGSQVFRWTHNGLEKMQILATNGPLALKFFEACGESYLLVINDYEYSTVFWWAGREFVNWDSLYDVKGMNKISIGYVQDETLILIAENNHIKIYRLLGNKLHMLTKISLFVGEEIISMSLHDNGESRLIIISRKEGKLHTSVFQINVVKGQIGDYNIQKPDQLLKCLLDLSDKLLKKSKIIKKIDDLLPNILSVRKDLAFNGKMVVNGTVHLKAPHVSVMETNTNGKQLLKNVSQIDDGLKKTLNWASQMRESIKNLVKRTESRHITGKLNVQGDLIFKSGKLDQMSVNKINEKIFEYSNKLTYDKEQIIEGKVGIKTLKTNKMNVKELNGIPLEDLLLRNGNQTVTGHHKVKELEVYNIHTKKESINDIDLKYLVTKNTQKVDGLKKITSVNANKISVLLLNDENATSIEDMFVHTSGGKYKVEKLTFGSKLAIKDLYVGEINGIDWEMFKSLVFLKGENQYINGTLKFVETMKTDHLSTNYVNKILMNDIMTKTTDQDILSSIKVNTLKANNINAELSNGLNLVNDVAQIGKINYINGFVKMDKVEIYNLNTDKNAKWIGIPRPEEIKQVIVYNGPVTIIGNFEVENIFLGKSALKVKQLDFDIWNIASKYWKFYEKEVRVGSINSNFLKIVGQLDLQKINGIKVKDIIHIISTEEIHGIAFGDVKTTVLNLKNVTISGINVQRLNKTTVMKRGNHIVRGHKKFNGGLIGENVYADRINDRNMTELVPLKANHLFLGKKIFSNIEVKKNVQVNDARVDLLNDIDLLSMVSSALRVDTSFNLPSIRLSTVIGNNIKATTINNLNFDNFVESLMMKTSTIRIKEVKMNGDIEFLGHLEIENLNGISLYPYLNEVVNKEIGGYVRGKKIFKDATVSVLKAQTIDGVNMEYLEKFALSKTKIQNITGYFKMENLLTDNLSTQEINGENVTNAVFVKGNDLIEIQSNVIFTDLIIKGDLKVLHLNGCDMKKAGEYLFGALPLKSIKMLNVTQQMDWEFPNTEENRSLSNLFSKAVKRNGENIIDGEVVFSEKVYTKWLITKGEINGVDVNMIAEDCVMKSSSEQELYGHKIFTSSMNASYVEVKGNANIKLVNGVDILHVNKTLVRKTENKEINGYKKFISGFQAEKMKCGGKVKGVSVSNIATTDDEILPPSEIRNLVINQNLDFKLVNSIDLSKLIQKRARCDDIGEITANLSFNGNVKLMGKAETSSINDINLNEIMLTESKKPQEISGKKQFQQSILIKGNLQTRFLNGYNLEEAYKFGILANEDVTIDGNIVFTGLVTIEDNLEVKYLVNSLDLFFLHKNAMQEHEMRIKSKESYKSKMEKQFIEHQKVIKGITSEFMYLEYENGIIMPDFKAVSASATAFTDNTLVSIHGQEECDLPFDCLCPIQYEVNITEEGTNWEILKSHKRHYRTYDSTGKLGAELFTNTISQDNKCRLQPEALKNEFNKIVWRAWSDDTETMEDDLNTDTFIFEGYVAHISSIAIEDSFYLAIAIYYDAAKSSHNTESLILKWTPGETSANIFQQIPTFGAKVMEIFQTEIGVFLFVGNSYDSDFKTNMVNNEIYRLDDQKTKFTLLRLIQTTGTYSAKCFFAGDEYFIAISQQFGSPVVIMKYNEEYDNFYLYQKLYLKATSLGIGVFYITGNNIIEAYLGIVVSDGSFHLYKYAYVEGFKKVMSQKQKGIQNFVPIYFGRNQLILTPTLFGNQMLRVVLQEPYY